jgi:hypothetical protein
MRCLFIKSSFSLDQLAARIAEVALHDFVQGGEYFKFSKDGVEIILVCNDTDHLEVFVESYQQFPFYCYSRRGAEGALQELLATLSEHGLACELAAEV